MDLTKEEKEKLCKGCLTYAEIEGIGCIIEPIFAERKCPCIKCLVKGVCNETCNIFDAFNYFQTRSLENNLGIERKW